MMMNAKRNAFLAALACAVILATVPAGPVAAAAEIDIPYKKFVLDNGLRLIVHEDAKAPIVAVNVWYHVGSKNERAGKTGFAHLFEHLMFNGSENHNDDYFKPFDRVGATDMNGTTNFDRTNYFQNVPTSALDMALWMESDRMGHLLGAVDQARLDEQRGVVQNEKRQGENQPYGKAFRLIFENTYPKGHPYSWSIIGSMEDLDAAALDDVHEWFKTYYGAANAVISVAGDVNAEEVKRKVERFFGDIPSGPPVERQQVWVAKREAEHRLLLEDRVPQARVYKAWNLPEWTAPVLDDIGLVSEVLTSGKTSRLHKRLVYDEQIATDVRSFVYARELGSIFVLWATAQPGKDLAEVERLLDEEMRRFIAEGPTTEELERVKTRNRADFIRGIERIGGFGGKSDILASSEVFGGSPDYYKERLKREAQATQDDLRDAARSWLSSGALVLEVRPFADHETVASDVDRSKLPEPEAWPVVRFPELYRASLPNGLGIILARRDAVPVVNFDLLVDAGYAADQFGKPGTGSLTLNMLDEGAASLTALQISDKLAGLGAELSTGSDLDTSTVRLSALKENLDESLQIFADVILRPAFAEDEFQRQKKQQLARIQREKSSPRQIGLRVLPQVLYSEGHAYGIPLTGSGTEDAVASLDRDDLRAFHETWFAPNNATLIVVGDTTMQEVRPKLERLFKSWKRKDVPSKNIGAVDYGQPTVYLIDRPDSLQSVIYAGHVAPPTANPDEVAIEAMNEVLGAGFSARINMNLREDKHWSYGARSQFFSARGQRPFFVRAPVQSDKTTEAMHEIQQELAGICGDRPPTTDEVARAKDKRTLTLPGRWETARAVSRSIGEIVRFGLPDDHWTGYADRVRGLSLDDVAGAAKQVVQPGKVIWVVVGDRAKIESGIRELNLGELRVIDADGNPVEGGGAAIARSD
jgi:zinc protease